VYQHVTLFRRSWLLLAILALVLGGALIVPGLVQANATPAWPLRSSMQPAALPLSFLYIPSNASTRGPLQVLVALHGMGNDGSGEAGPLLAEAERTGWIVLAPTFSYGDWRDPDQVRQDDALFLPQLKALLDDLPARTGLTVRPRALLYGFSRGGQLAHRFAEFYPRSTLGLATFSCGTYTLPYAQQRLATANLPLAFPFGLADLDRYTGRSLDLEALRRVSFLIGVGAHDTVAADLPRQWDPYLGTTRVERAQAYQQALTAQGVPAQLVLFPNAIHLETDEMRARALEFLTSLPS
jgi:pimeloyl-ACP methyl ester carboxylesterase